MPPSSRRRTRREAELVTSDAPEPDTMNTPSRKRRRTNGSDTNSRPAPAKPAEKASRAASESDATIDHTADTIESENPNSVAEECIRRLKVAAYRVQASIDYNNDIVDNSREAYAKIAGKDWTFYVVSTKVVVGRPIKAKRDSTAPSQEPTESKNETDIDLGPDQLISRNHAQIDYDGDTEQWIMTVNGRNGVLVDESRCDRGQRIVLRSGMVFAILGTQMMFLLPQGIPEVSAEIRRQLLSDPAEVTEDEKDAELPTPANRGRGSFIGMHHPSSATRGLNLITSSAVQQAASGLQNLSNPGTPLSRSQLSQPKSKQSPIYARGLMLDSTEDIDYSLPTSKDIKPPFSYAQMIGQAILSKPEENATLAQIYEFIKERYAYFRETGTGWQNSIRHNLSLSKSFEKIPRRTDEPGKGMKWRIVEDQRDEFVKKQMQALRPGMKGSSSTGRMGSSGPNSPAGTVIGAAAQTERLLGALGDHPQLRRPERSTTPPLVGYPTANESFTPDRGSNVLLPGRGFLNGNTSHAMNTVTPGRPPVLSQASVGPPPRMGLNDGAINSPPALYDGMHGNNFFTPMVARSKPLLPVPSTVKLPSFYAKELFSSPAPFWKYVDINSTPARPPIGLNLSPEKSDVEDELDEGDEQGDEQGDESEGAKRQLEGEAIDAAAQDIDDSATQEDKETASRPINPSSPPSSGNEGEDLPDASPTRTLSRPASRRVTESAPQRPAANIVGSLKQSMESMPRFAPPPTSALGAAQLNQGARLGNSNLSNSMTAGQHAGLTPLTAGGGIFGAATGMNSGAQNASALGGMAPAGRMPDLGPALNPYALPEVDEDEEEEIDLAKGFQNIGSFHRLRFAANGA